MKHLQQRSLAVQTSGEAGNLELGAQQEEPGFIQGDGAGAQAGWEVGDTVRVKEGGMWRHQRVKETSLRKLGQAGGADAGLGRTSPTLFLLVVPPALWPKSAPDPQP